jgi:hypothetical protein
VFLIGRISQVQLYLWMPRVLSSRNVWSKLTSGVIRGGFSKESRAAFKFAEYIGFRLMSNWELQIDFAWHRHSFSLVQLILNSAHCALCVPFFNPYSDMWFLICLKMRFEGYHTSVRWRGRVRDLILGLGQIHCVICWKRKLGIKMNRWSKTTNTFWYLRWDCNA